MDKDKPDFARFLPVNDKARNAVYSLERFKVILGHIDYGCNFVGGKCVFRREHPKSTFGRGVRCCCIGCADSCGHYSGPYDLLSKKAVAFLTRRFSKTKGFWRSGVGCIVPRKWRSATCVSYNCCGNDPQKRGDLSGINSTISALTRNVSNW